MVTFETISKCLVSPETLGGILASLVAYLFYALPCLRRPKRDYSFPESDLLTTLVTTYFTHIAPMLPFLHRPTFMTALDDGLHIWDDKFGALVLLVCATASRYS